MAGVVLLSRSTHPCEPMHGRARTFSEQVIPSIIYDLRCGISDVAFRTAPPFGGLSCSLLSNLSSVGNYIRARTPRNCHLQPVSFHKVFKSCLLGVAGAVVRVL